MINVPSAMADLTAAPGDRVVYSKAQVAQMLAEVEIGQRARIALVNLKTITAAAVGAVGAVGACA